MNAIGNTFYVLKSSLIHILIWGDGMGYRILYHTVQKKPGNRRLSIRLPVLTLICFLLFLFLVDILWPEGAAAIQMAVSAVREAEAFSLFNDLAEELRFGEPLVTAFSDFCGKLIP